MRIGLKGAFGQKQITLDDTATVAELLVQISEATSFPEFEVKDGFPPQPIDFSKIDSTLPLSDVGLNLNGHRLQVDAKSAPTREEPPSKARPSTQTESSRTVENVAPKFSGRNTRSKETQGGLIPIKNDTSKVEKDPPEMPLHTPPNDSYLILRVMPDDNSCLFRAIGKCVLGNELDPMTELRSIVAQAIQRDTTRYNAAVLEKEPDDYCKWIQHPDHWGGAIEIGIIAEAFDIEVCAVNISDGSIQRFNDSTSTPRMRSYLVYSGIHWDTIVENAAGKWGPVDIDVAQFDPYDSEVEDKALKIGAMLKNMGYYTDTNKFSISCNICGWKGAGENSAIEHVKETGHQNFGQVE
jgi:ubiquitin thioesterase OTU1